MIHRTLSCAAALLLALPSWGQTPTTRLESQPTPRAAGESVLLRQSRLAPGTTLTSTYTIQQIGAAAFHSRLGESTLWYDVSGLVFDQGPVSVMPKYWAPVDLPDGAEVTYLDLYACDHSPSAHVTVSLERYLGWDIPQRRVVATVSSTQRDGWGCGYWTVPLSHVINNNVRYGGGSHYVITLSFGATGHDPDLDIAWNYLKGVDLWWRPATAATVLPSQEMNP